MGAEGWFALVGALLLGIALVGSLIRTLPLSTAMVYLALGAILGTGGLGLIKVDDVDDARIVERLTEFTVVVSLFASGLKLRAPFTDRRWRPALKLATLTMVVSIALVALLGHFLLALPLGAAILLGAILAPTDPVLATDVQVGSTEDRSTLKWALSGEASLNDGAAFPFVMLGLGLLGLHELGDYGLRWVAVDLIWATVGGLGIGWILGQLTARATYFIRKHHSQAVGYEEFVTLGLISGAYGIALLAKAYGFLAVFAAGLALRHYEMGMLGAEKNPEQVMDEAEPEGEEELAVHEDTAAAHLAQSVSHFTEGLERMSELAVVLVVGAMLARITLSPAAVGVGLLTFVLVRPLAVWLTFRGRGIFPRHRLYAGWFGIRGIGSLYYLAYALEHGVTERSALADTLAGVVLGVIAASTVIHGVSATPLMNLYGRLKRGRTVVA